MFSIPYKFQHSHSICVKNKIKTNEQSNHSFTWRKKKGRRKRYTSTPLSEYCAILIVGKNLRGSKRNEMLVLDQNENTSYCMWNLCKNITVWCAFKSTQVIIFLWLSFLLLFLASVDFIQHISTKQYFHFWFASSIVYSWMKIIAVINGNIFRSTIAAPLHDLFE